MPIKILMLLLKLFPNTPPGDQICVIFTLAITLQTLTKLDKIW